jgi:ABC-type Fe3+-hydroxamate transport system substrate-binding protein
MLTDRAGWSGVRAVREGRVIAGPDPNLIEQPGPRILQAVERLRRSFQESAVAP